MPRFVAIGSLIFLSVAINSGCGNGGPKLDPSLQATITGSVSVKGELIPVDSSVYFSCKETGTTAAGKIDSLGKFSATPPDPKRGLPKGRYHVMVRPPAPEAVPASPGDQRYRDMMMSGGKALKSTTEPSLVPSSFLLLETTKLILEVKPGPNNFDIDLAKIK